MNGNPTEADPYGTNPDNPTMTAGSTFVGQFIDHDITFDQTSSLGMPQDPLELAQHPHAGARPRFGVRRRARRAARTLRPNGDGSVGPKLKIGTGGVHEDVPAARTRRRYARCSAIPATTRT